MRELVVLFLIINALFWGLMPHSLHCEVVGKFTSSKCVPHTVHILLGIVFFVLAVLVSQEEWTSEVWKSIKTIFSNVTKVVQSGGKLITMAASAAKENFNSVEDFTNKVDALSSGKYVQIKLV
jgi:hypothetical protein